MRPHPKLRKAAKWAGLALTLLFLLAWTGAMVSWTSWQGTSGAWCIAFHGCIKFGDQGYVSPFASTGFAFGFRFPEPLIWWPSWLRFFNGWQACLPLWIPCALALACTITAWRLDTLAAPRTRTPACRACKYPLTGLASATRCPECGTPTNMRRHGIWTSIPPRARAWIKWITPLATMLLMMIWMGSAWYGLSWLMPGGQQLSIRHGTLGYTRWHFPGVVPHDVGMSRLEVAGMRWHASSASDNMHDATSICLWPLVAISLALTGVVWYADFRANRRTRGSPTHASATADESTREVPR